MQINIPEVLVTLHLRIHNNNKLAKIDLFTMNFNHYFFGKNKNKNRKNVTYCFSRGGGGGGNGVVYRQI